MISKTKEKIAKRLGYGVLLLLGIIILFWSLVTAGWDNMVMDMKANRLRTIPIEYVKEIGNGEKILKNYKVPESRVEPGNIGYILKKFRDQLWIRLSRTPKTRAEVYLLVADKRMYETVNLIKNQKSEDLILETLNDSVYNLKEAKKTLSTEDQKDIEVAKVDQQINEAGLAYEDIVKSFNYKDDKINNVINDLKNWNQKNGEQK